MLKNIVLVLAFGTDSVRSVAGNDCQSVSISAGVPRRINTPAHSILLVPFLPLQKIAITPKISAAAEARMKQHNVRALIAQALTCSSCQKESSHVDS